MIEWLKKSIVSKGIHPGKVLLMGLKEFCEITFWL